MRIATPKYKLLIPQIEVEPNTTEGIERVEKALTDEEQLITRFSINGVPLQRANVDRGVYGLFKPFDTDPARPVGQVEVLIQPIAGSQSPLLFVGPYVLVAGRDYAVGAAVGDTATNIAAAISNIPNYDGTPAGAVVTVQGPVGGMDLRFDVEYLTSDENFQFTYTGSFLKQLGYVEDPIFPPDLA